MPRNVFVDPSARVDETALSQRNVYARSPTATIGEPVLPRIGETHKETPSFTMSKPRFAGNVPTLNPSSSAEEVSPQNFMVGQPKNHISDLQFGKYALLLQPSSVGSQTKVCSGSNSLSEPVRCIKEVEMATSVADLETSRSIFWKSIPHTSRRLMRRSLPP